MQKRWRTEIFLFSFTGGVTTRVEGEHEHGRIGKWVGLGCIIGNSQRINKENMNKKGKRIQNLKKHPQKNRKYQCFSGELDAT